MAPNNGLKPNPKKNDDSNKEGKSGLTTVLKAGTVEARGIGSLSQTKVHDDIRLFLNGEGRFSVKAETRAFFTVWTFITRLPGPTWVDHHPGYLMRGMAYFPLGGLLVGIFVSVFFDAAHALFQLPTIVSAAASTAASLWVTGCFHEDGLADASDGIGGGWSRKQILTIMTDTRLGTYGCAVLMLYSITKLELLAALGTSDFSLWDAKGGAPALLASHCLARCTAPFLIRTRDYIDEFGPKYKFYSFMVQAKHLVSWERVGFALLTGFTTAACLYGVVEATILMISMLVLSYFSGRYGTYLLGGIMGDYLGATICLTELLVLTLVLSLQNIDLNDTVMAVTTTSFTTEKAMDFVQEVMTRFQNHEVSVNEPLGVTLRFGIVILITVLWCANVGHPPVLVRDTVVEKIEQQQDQTIDSSSISSDGKKDDNDNDDTRTFEERYDNAREYLDSLAKPVGSLGTLEDWAARLAALQKTLKPRLGRAVCLIFAGDHGVAKPPSDGGEGCSAYPSVVTQSILHGLEREVAGASVLAKENHVALKVLDVGVAGDYTADASNKIVRSATNKLVGGTQNFCKQPAMTLHEAKRCVRMGREELRQCLADNDDDRGSLIVALGEVGIGNSTSSAALIAALTGADPERVCGGGATTSRTADPAVVSKKVGIVKNALQLHHEDVIQAYHEHNNSIKNGSSRGNGVTMDVLAALGGCEIAAMVGCILEAAALEDFHGICVPILVDGFIATTAALVAAHLEPRSCRVMFFTTKSGDEAGQAMAIESIQGLAWKHGIAVPVVRPALDMGLRLGEGSGAILSVPILRSASAVLNNMATLQSILEG